jgi:hypothetical protein
MQPAGGRVSGRGIGTPTGRSRATLLPWGDYCRSEHIRAASKWEIQTKVFSDLCVLPSLYGSFSSIPGPNNDVCSSKEDPVDAPDPVPARRTGPVGSANARGTDPRAELGPKTLPTREEAPGYYSAGRAGEAGDRGRGQLRARAAKQARRAAPAHRGQGIFAGTLLPRDQQARGPASRAGQGAVGHGGHRHQRQLRRRQCGFLCPRGRKAGVPLAGDAPRRAGRAACGQAGRSDRVRPFRRQRRRQHQQRSGQLGRCQGHSGRRRRGVAGRSSPVGFRAPSARRRLAAVLVRIRRSGVRRTAGELAIRR